MRQLIGNKYYTSRPNADLFKSKKEAQAHAKKKRSKGYLARVIIAKYAIKALHTGVVVGRVFASWNDGWRVWYRKKT